MGKEIRVDKKAVFLCEECDLGYADKETAQRCETWCSETKSCSLEITRKAREIARERLEYMKQFFERLKKEINGQL